MYICQSQSSNLFRPLPRLVSIHLFSMSMCLFLPCRWVHLYHFLRFHIYTLIYDICLFLTYSLCMTVHLCLYKWHNFLPIMGNIILYICTSLSIPLLIDIQVVSMSWLLEIVLQWTFGVHISFWIIVFSRYMPRSGIAVSDRSSVFSFFKKSP